MPAIRLDGIVLAEQIKQQVRLQVNELKQNGIIPQLAVILVGDNPASKVYVNRKSVSCQEVGIKTQQIVFAQTVSENQLIQTIQKLNMDLAVHGILIQLPLPDHLNENKILDTVNPQKDVDGFHFENQGKLLNNAPHLIPNTPRGILALIKSTGVPIEGKHAVVIGRSKTVGKPMSLLLLNENATVTVCHSKTKNLTEKTRQADILVVAIGQPRLITADMVKPGAIVIDVGINRTENGLAGDVDFEHVQSVAGFISPVPGGVGPLTVACLMENTLKACQQQTEALQKNVSNKKPVSVGVLASTRATDLQAIINSIENRSLLARIGVVISDQKDAFALERARKHNIANVFLDKTHFASKELFDSELVRILKKHETELVLLIGYKRFLSKVFLDAFPNRVLNIHPSLLPAFGGSFDTDVHDAVLQSKVKITGATLHLATEHVDAGPIVSQKAVAIQAGETVESLKEKVQNAEQELLIAAIRNFGENNNVFDIVENQKSKKEAHN